MERKRFTDLQKSNAEKTSGSTERRSFTSLTYVGKESAPTPSAAPVSRETPKPQNGYVSVADLNRETNGSGVQTSDAILRQAAADLAATLPQRREPSTTRTYWDGTTRQRRDRGAMLRNKMDRGYDTEGSIASGVERGLGTAAGAGAAAVDALSDLNYLSSNDRNRIENARKNLETYTANRDTATNEAERQRWQKLADHAQNEINAYTKGSEAKQQNAAGLADALRGTQEEFNRRASAGDYTARAGRALETVEKYGDNRYDDTVSGRWGANYGVGRLSQNSSYAWNEYLNNPTPENRRIAELYDTAIGNTQEQNADALSRDGTLRSWEASIANYAPQFVDQTKARLVGGAIGFVAGGNVAAGQAAGSAADMYAITRGAAFKGLLDNGVPEDLAMKMAKDEALISSIIEYADSLGEYAFMGGKEIVSLLLRGGADMAGTTAGKSAGKAAAKKIAAYLGNIAQEYGEEFTQEAVSVANEQRLANGTTDSGKLSLASAAADVAFRNGVLGEDPEIAARLREAGREGAKIATVFGAIQGGTGYAADRINSRYSTETGMDALARAAREVAEAGAVSDKTAADILRNKPVSEAMQNTGAVTLTDDMTEQERRDAVKAAFAEEQAETPATPPQSAQNATEQARLNNLTPAENAPANAQKTGYFDNIEKTDAENGQSTRRIDHNTESAETQETPLNGRNLSDEQITAEFRSAARLSSTLGRNGAAAFMTAYNADTADTISAEDAFGGFAKVYNAALNGKTIPDTNIPDTLRIAAESSGKRDAQDAAQKRYFGEDAGLAANRPMRPRNLSARDARILDAIGKATGVQIKFADHIGGVDDRGAFSANAKIENGVLTIARDADDPIKAAFTHEIVHRLRETAPGAYRVLSQFVMDSMSDERFDSALREHMERYGSENVSDMTEETVADAFGTILDNPDLLERAAGIDRTFGQKLLDAVQEIIAKIKRALGAKEAQFSPEQVEAFRELQGKADDMAKLLGDALNKVQSANRENVNASDETRYSRKIDADYMAAVERGDTETAQKMVDEAAKAAGYNVKVYHGTPSETISASRGRVSPSEYENLTTNYADKLFPFVVFRPNSSHSGIYTTTNQGVAKIFSFNFDRKGTIYDLYARMDNPLVIDSNGRGWTDVSVDSIRNIGYEKQGRSKIDDIVAFAKDRGYDGLVVKNVREGGVGNETDVLTNDVIVFSPEQVKSADPVTYDDNGNVIPLSERFNSGNNDIRYSRMVDSEGRELTEAQAEYFRNSKARDENGNLLTLYHGTTEYDEIKKFKKGLSGWLGPGVYLTNRKTDAQRYADAMGPGNGTVYELYANVTNPLIVTESNPVPEILRAAYNRDSVYEARHAKQTNDPNIITSADIKKLQSKGYDGIRWNFGKSVEISVFSPEKVKRADNMTPTSNPDIRYSRKYSDAERKEHADAALAHFGKTFSWNETGYLTQDGKRIDFSGRHDGAPGGHRTVDHRDVSDALGDDYGGGDYSGAMIQFMSEGNIRISPEVGGINVQIEPTEEQYEALKDFISRKRGEVIVDYDDENGNTVDSVEYDRGTKSSKVIEDIRERFKNGTATRQSLTAQFHERYSRRRESGADQTELRLMRENDRLREQLSYWKAQTKRTPEESVGKVSEKDVRKTAAALVDAYGSTISANDIVPELQSLYDLMGTGKNENGELSYDAAREIANSVAQKIAENAIDDTESAYGNYADLRKFLRDTPITVSQGDAAGVSNWGDWRKHNMGRLNVRRGDTSNIDVIYDELSDRWPEFFPGDVISVGDQLNRMADVMETIYNDRGHNPFDPYMDQAVIDIGNDVMERFFDIPQAKTFADKVLERQKRATAERKEAVDRAFLAGQMSQGRVMAEQMRTREARQEERLRRVRETLQKSIARRDERLERQAARFRAKTEEGREKQSAARLRKMITRHTAELSRRLLAPTDKKHIPDPLRNPVAAMLEAINKESAYETVIDENGKHRRVKAGTDASGEVTKRTQAFRALKEQYANAQKESNGDLVIDPDLLGDESEGFQGLFDRVIAMSDTPIQSMNTEQLETVWRVVRAVEHSIRNYGKTLAATKYKTTEDWARRFFSDTQKRRERSSSIAANLALDLENPYTFFAQFGQSGKDIYRMLRNAQDRQRVMLDEIGRDVKDLVDEKTVDKWRRERHDITTERGENLTLTTAQLMEIYNLSKREQAQDHLMRGGIVQPEIKRDGKAPKIERGADVVRLTAGDLEQLAGMLTREQREVADGLQQLTADKLAAWGNEASMRAYGYRKFTERNYWPIHSAKEALHSNVEKNSGNVRSIKNIGMAKAVVPHASNGLTIGDVFDTFADHTADMVDYATWLLPMEDASRLYNFKYKGEDKDTFFKQQLDRVGGRNGKAQRYWENLMANIQNGIYRGGRTDFERLASGAVGKVKGASVGANVRVIVQQPTAFLRANAVINPASLTRGLIGGVTGGNGWQKALQYAPIARIKDAGGFDQGNMRSVNAELFGDRGVLTRIGEAAAKGAQAADAATWGRLWNAAEWETKRQNPAMEAGSAEFYRKTAELFTDVIDQSQVVDGVLQRSAIMRSADGLTQQATSFMGEPLMALNMLMRSLDAVRYETDQKRRSAAIKQFGRVVVALAVTDIVNSAVQSLVDAYRDDDRDKDYWERFLEKLTGVVGDEQSAGELLKNVYFGGNLAENMSIVRRIPYAKDAVSMWQGFTVKRMDTQAVNDLITAIKQLGNKKWSVGYGTLRVAEQAAKIAGIPAAAIERDALGTARSIVYATDDPVAIYKFDKSIYNPATNKSRFYQSLYLALEQGSVEDYTYLRDDLTASGGMTSKAIDDAMKSLYNKKVKANDAYTIPQGSADLLGIRQKYSNGQEDGEEKFSADSLPATDYTRYTNQRAASYKSYRDALTATPEFKALTDKDKDRAMNWAYSLANDYALEANAGGEYRVTTKWETYAKDAERYGIDSDEYLLFHVIYETSGTDYKDGKAIKGQSKSDKAHAWLDKRRDLTSGQKEWLWSTVYTSDF